MADQNIALGVQVPDTMKNISGMLNFANQAQQYQQGNVALQKEQIVLGERKAIQSLFQNPQAFTAPDGTTDYQKLINEGMKVAPTTFPTMVPQIIQAHKSSVEAQSSLDKLTESQRNQVGQFVMSLGSDTPDVARKKLDGLLQTNPQLKPAIDFAWKYSLEPAAANPQVWQQATLKVGQAAMAPGAQEQALTMSGPTVSTGQSTRQVNTRPMAGPIGATIPGTEAQQQLPPTAQVFNPATQAMEYVGPQGKGWVGAEPTGAFVGDRAAIEAEINRIPDPQKRMEAMRALQNQLGGGGGAGGRAQAGPALGQAAGIEGTVESVNKDWQETAATAGRAAQDIGILQKIKEYAPGAVKGVLNDRRSFVAGLAGLLGMDAAEMAKTSTDILAKNSNMLALTGGNTDLARSMAEMANPNVKMTEGAIKSAADQIIAQRKLMLAKQQFMQPYKALNDPNVYSKALTIFNQAADPRILQLADMTTDEKSKMKAAMSESERREFGEKIRKLQELGIVK